MATALRRDGRAAAEPFPGLRVIQDRVYRVDGVLRRAVPLLGGPPVLHDPRPGLGVTVHRLAPQARSPGSPYETAATLPQSHDGALPRLADPALRRCPCSPGEAARFGDLLRDGSRYLAA